jgi:hypothetical protein
MASKAPPPSSLRPPAGVPSGGSKYIVVAILLLLGIGGIVFWKISQKPPPPVAVVDASAPVATFNARNPEDDVPPPPPIEDAGPKTDTKAGTTRTANMCNSPRCTGSSGTDLESQLQFRVKQSHRCYDNALAQDPTLRGKVTLAVRVGATGQVCSANVASNEMGSSTVASCVSGYFRGANFPAPRGGCVDVNIPIKFEPRQ